MHVYVCPNHRGYKQYSYGSLHDKSFKEIWNDISVRENIMNTINNVECFKNCTKLCKPHESNKMMWYLHENINNIKEEELLSLGEKVKDSITHPEFV